MKKILARMNPKRDRPDRNRLRFEWVLRGRPYAKGMYAGYEAELSENGHTVQWNVYARSVMAGCGGKFINGGSADTVEAAIQAAENAMNEHRAAPPSVPTPGGEK